MRQGLGKEENDHLGSKAEEDHQGSGFEGTEIVHRATSFGPQGRGSAQGVWKKQRGTRAASGLNLHVFPFCQAQDPATLASCSHNSNLWASTSTLGGRWDDLGLLSFTTREEEARGLSKGECDHGIPLLCTFFVHWVVQVAEDRHQAE